MYFVADVVSYLSSGKRVGGNGYGGVTHLGRNWFKKCCGQRTEKFRGTSHGVKVAYFMRFFACLKCGVIKCEDENTATRYAHSMMDKLETK